MKVLISSLILAAIVASSVALHYDWGKIQPKDVVLDNQVVFNASIRNKAVTRSITYPAKNQKVPKNISAISLNDRIPNGGSGFARIVAGGIGKKTVTINFTSLYEGAINYTMIIYGKY